MFHVKQSELFASGLFPASRQIIRINNQPFTVAGVMASKGQSGMGQDQDDVVYTPYTTVMKKLRGITYVQNITVSAASAADTAPTADRIATLLRTRHQIRDEDDFMVRTMEEMASVRVQATETMTALLASIAGVSLLVGVVGALVTPRRSRAHRRALPGAASGGRLGGQPAPQLPPPRSGARGRTAAGWSRWAARACGPWRLWRTARADSQIGGTPVVKGEHVMCHITSANRGSSRCSLVSGAISLGKSR